MTPKEVRQLWVKALRSGEYQQGTNCLRTDDGKYCCLGVLTDLAVKNGVIPNFRGEGNGHNKVLTLPVMTWAGLRSSSGCYGDAREKSLSSDNDKGCGFKNLADIIESEPSAFCSI